MSRLVLSCVVWSCLVLFGLVLLTMSTMFGLVWSGHVNKVNNVDKHNVPRGKRGDPPGAFESVR